MLLALSGKKEWYCALLKAASKCLYRNGKSNIFNNNIQEIANGNAKKKGSKRPLVEER
jgi:hypothetical protein